ncbi:hypothetical protein U3516DRAFT_871720 [Neocallimastix sp. 'constans']
MNNKSGLSKQENINRKLSMARELEDSDNNVVDWIEDLSNLISISIGYIDVNSKVKENKLADLINKKFIIIIDTGSEHNNFCNDKSNKVFYSYAGYHKVISVGVIDTKLNGHGYSITTYSNFGEIIDIYAPDYVVYPYLEYGSITDIDEGGGTSCSTTLDAGVAASILSEHPKIKFDNESIKRILIEMFVKDAIVFKKFEADDTPNRFINNIYYTDNSNIRHVNNINKNDKVCSDGCCTKDMNLDIVQHKKKSVEECEKELKEN